MDKRWWKQMVESLHTHFKRMKEKSRGVFRTHSNIYDGASLQKQKKKISPLMRKERKQIYSQKHTKEKRRYKLRRKKKIYQNANSRKKKYINHGIKSITENKKTIIKAHMQCPLTKAIISPERLGIFSRAFQLISLLAKSSLK